jgi:hypothetical protein
VRGDLLRLVQRPTKGTKTMTMKLTQDEALAIWHNMTPFQRADLMSEVGYVKSVPKYLRLCIKHIRVAGA